MADVFSSNSTADDAQTPAIKVASALRGDEEDGATDETPQAAQPQGTVDSSAQSYLVPAAADDGSSATPAPTATSDAPVSADTRAYATPIAPPTLGKYQAPADHSADRAEMTAQKEAESRQNIKPSIGRRILAGLAGGATAFGGGDGERVVQGVLNRPAQEAQQQWALQEAPIQAKLQADQAQDAATQEANNVTGQQNRVAETDYGNQIRGQQDQARAQSYAAAAAARNGQVNSEGWHPDDPNNPLGGYSATSIDGKTLHSTTAPAAVQNSAEYRIADAASKGHPFTPEQQQILRGGGKLTFRPPPNPRQPAVGAVELQAAEAAFRRQYGRGPQTLDEQNQIAQTAKGMLGGSGGGGANDPGAVIAKNMQDKQEYIDSLTKNDKDVTDSSGAVLSPKGSLVDKNGNTVSPQQFNDRLEKFRTDLNANPVMRKSGTMVDAQGNTVNNRFSRNPQPAAAQQPQQSQQQQPAYKAKSGGTVTINTHVIVNGRPGVVTGFDAKGKPVVKY